MLGTTQAEWNLLAGGKPYLPTTGEGACSYFGTGHVAALAHLAYNGDIFVASLCDNTGMLVRWGAPVTDAAHRELNTDAQMQTLQHAAIAFDMRTRRLVAVPGLSKGARKAPPPHATRIASVQGSSLRRALHPACC